jgi:hypothetical protein
MEILDDEYAYAGRMDIHSNEINSSGDFVERLIYYFSLTKEERMKAGIFVGREGREWLENSALVLPPPEFWE